MRCPTTGNDDKYSRVPRAWRSRMENSKRADSVASSRSNLSMVAEPMLMRYANACDGTDSAQLDTGGAALRPGGHSRAQRLLNAVTAYCIEPKWDGIRTIARRGSRVELFSRNANRFTGFPDITQAFSTAVAGRSAILDGKLVALDMRARPRFDLIQRRLRCSHLLAAVPAVYVLFCV